MSGEVFLRDDARREGLSYNPILTILETTSALKRDDFADTLVEANLVSYAERRIFEHHGVRRKLYFTVAPLGEFVAQDAREFTGFQKSDGVWMLKFGIDEAEFVPVSSVASSLQIQNFREEAIRQEK